MVPSSPVSFFYLPQNFLTLNQLPVTLVSPWTEKARPRSPGKDQEAGNVQESTCLAAPKPPEDQNSSDPALGDVRHGEKVL